MKRKYEFPFWNQESDVICDSTPPLLPTSHPDILKFTPWAYSLNTATGFYRKSINKDFLNDDNLLKINLETTIEVFSNVSVCPHKYYDKFMIVILHETKQIILIDSRGIFYELPIIYRPHCYDISVELDKQNGCYVLDHSLNIVHKKNN